ncbi:sugar transferase [Sediminicoccus sp. KRV36]|uniref:sugar transferase n=1 Tax=Sediminicoccus sp. KRV36 TaxID=3133721 RepID=UPI00200E63AD|nr:sugar transferase [Sediminicoccus rosea]UPY35795.1 sugar transferase [Sediminicoccus rosea]
MSLHIPTKNERIRSDTPKAGRSAHGILLSLVLGTAAISLGVFVLLGMPIVEWTVAGVVLFLVLLMVRVPVWRRPSRVAILGSVAFQQASEAAALRQGKNVVFALDAPDINDHTIRAFLAASDAKRPGTILIELPENQRVLAPRLVHLVEAVPARVLLLCGRGDAAATEGFLGQDFTLVAPAPLGPLQYLSKRALDLAIALPALLLLTPLLLAIAIAVRLGSPGGALFRQYRIGRLGQRFAMLKFRSMHADAQDDGGGGTARDDPRVTPLGRWLRTTSLDELPQLFNVVLGQMSIVGPRPHIPTHRVEHGVYSQVIPEYGARHRVAPGITGLAQISGMRGGIQTMQKAARSVSLDMIYIRRWSLWLDIRIIYRTLTGGMMGRDVF